LQRRYRCDASGFGLETIIYAQVIIALVEAIISLLTEIMRVMKMSASHSFWECQRAASSGFGLQTR
jgi:hypothetical protein